ncbi:MAG TPA: hypothetical protein VE196_03325 [Pseudonocardiaceae bacterium]|nr:hypothetical protein [Pseudonocardiaceae bacterium]
MTSTPTPALEPTEVQTRDRGRRLLWAVGQPDEEGFQAYAELRVLHFATPRYGYLVTPRRARIQRRGDLTCEDMSLLGRTEERIAWVAAKRFAAARMRRVLDAALVEVRERFAAGDAVIGSYWLDAE